MPALRALCRLNAVIPNRAYENASSQRSSELTETPAAAIAAVKAAEARASCNHCSSCFRVACDLPSTAVASVCLLSVCDATLSVKEAKQREFDRLRALCAQKQNIQLGGREKGIGEQRK